MAPSTSADLELMRASALLESDPAGAARRASDILCAWPGHAEASLLLGTALRRLGDGAAAAERLESLARANPDSPLLQLELGRAYASGARRAEAVAALRRAVAIDSGLADAWRELAEQLFAAGETLEGDRAYARYLRLWREPPELGDAARALSENRLEAAESILRRHVQHSPQDVVALRMLAGLAGRREDPAEAERRLSECLAIAPGYGPARYDLAALLYEQQRIPEALELVERLLALEPDNVDCLSLKARSVRLIGRTDDALALMEEAVGAHPDEDRAWLLYGHLLRELGQIPRAIGMFRRALAVRPACGHAYSSLANLKTFRFESTDLAAMRAQLAPGAARGADRIEIEFALGKALEDAAEFAPSFEHYQRGNALYRATILYEPDAISAETEMHEALFSPEFFAARAGWGSARRDPIFIVGVPRSGSTLLEQMLASHSRIEGTHELIDMGRLAFELWTGGNGARQPYPQPVAALSRDEIEGLSARYLSRTQAYRAQPTAHFVDKMLGNFTHIGLIQLMFPQAPIIDVRRHPLGCGFSCYKQLFGRGQKYSYDLRELGRYYRDYVRLMEHFDAVLPGRVHRLYYERLVAEPRSELQKVFEYCGLPFEEPCLRFYENPRIVRTISSEQVRQPLYTGSIEQWRNYEPWLGPLKEALGDLVERYPAAAPPEPESDQRR
jgi:tetratricopeptide (TPR) repeat protein